MKHFSISPCFQANYLAYRHRSGLMTPLTVTSIFQLAFLKEGQHFHFVSLTQLLFWRGVLPVFDDI